MSDERDLDEVQSVTMHYIKSNLFRVIHVDGAMGTPTPAGAIHMAVYSERPAIPQTTVHPLVDGQLGEPTAMEGRVGFVRELEASLMLTPKIARDLAAWLLERADELENLGSENGQ